MCQFNFYSQLKSIQKLLVTVGHKPAAWQMNILSLRQKNKPKKLQFISLAYQKIISLLRQVCAKAGGRRWNSYRVRFNKPERQWDDLICRELAALETIIHFSYLNPYSKAGPTNWRGNDTDEGSHGWSTNTNSWQRLFNIESLLKNIGSYLFKQQHRAPPQQTGSPCRCCSVLH